MAKIKRGRSTLRGDRLRAEQQQRDEDQLTVFWRNLRKRANACARSATGLYLRQDKKNGYAYAFDPGPFEGFQRPYIQFGLPNTLRHFANKRRGHAGDRLGVRWDNEGYVTVEDAARDFANMMNEVEYFIHKMQKNKDRY